MTATLVLDFRPELLVGAAGTAVGTIPDQVSGVVNLIQNTTNNKPTISTTPQQIDGFNTLHFDGANDQMACGTFTAIAQPFAVVVIARIYNINNGVIFGSANPQIVEGSGLWAVSNGGVGLYGGRLESTLGYPGTGVH